MSAKSQKRIKVAAEATRYYTQIGWDLTAANIHQRTLLSFSEQWKALMEKKKQDDRDVPLLGKLGSILK